MFASSPASTATLATPEKWSLSSHAALGLRGGRSTRSSSSSSSQAESLSSSSSQVYGVEAISGVPISRGSRFSRFTPGRRRSALQCVLSWGTFREIAVGFSPRKRAVTASSSCDTPIGRTGGWECDGRRLWRRCTWAPLLRRRGALSWARGLRCSPRTGEDCGGTELAPPEPPLEVRRPPDRRRAPPQMMAPSADSHAGRP